MSQKLQPVRGTHDILPDEFEKFSVVIDIARRLAMLSGFREMMTPIFESTDVFSRSMGITSDVVHKEMFTFNTKGEESVTLRPEFTAGIIRAFISNGMQQNLPLRIFSTGPIFRYERPQKGRQRQFHQVNFEWLGDDSPEVDIEIIILAGRLLYYLSGKQSCTLLINTLGDHESRLNYRKALVAYLTPFASDLSEDSQRRLAENPLRILDSKDPRDKKVTAGAPKITDYLNERSRLRFDRVRTALDPKKLPFLQDVIVSPSLVRGLDYYTDTVFEFIANTGELGAQNTVLAGGRYDGLVEQMGGNSTPAIGFAAGVERLLLLMDKWDNTKDIKIVFVPFEDVDRDFVQLIAGMLRVTLFDWLLNRQSARQFSVEIDWQGKLSKRMERAAKKNASHVIILGSEEINRGACQIKNMDSGQQAEIPLNALKSETHVERIFNLNELDSRLRGNDENMDPGLRRDDE